MYKMFDAEVKIEDADQGIVSAVISTFGEIDHDGDVTLAEGFPTGKVVMSAYNHKSWDGALPYGYGEVTKTATEGRFKGQFLMDTQHGADAFRVVKALSGQGLQQWSYSLHAVKAQRKMHKSGVEARFLNGFDMHEVSPVIKGASIGTRTLDIKGHKQYDSMISRMLNEAGNARWYDTGGWAYLDDFDVDNETAIFCVRDADGNRSHVQLDFTRTDTSVTLGDQETVVEPTVAYLPKGLQFAEHIKVVMAAVDDLAARAEQVVSLRAEKGKSISEEAKSQLLTLRDRLNGLAKTHDPTDDTDEALKQYLMSVKSRLRTEK